MLKQFFTNPSYGYQRDLLKYSGKLYELKTFRQDPYLSNAIAHAELIQQGVVDERAVRASAGLTMMLAMLVFCAAFFYGMFLPITLFASYSFLDFVLRVCAGVQFSPTLVLSNWITQSVLGMQAEWVSAIPKRFAWTIGIILSGVVATLFWTEKNGLTTQLICGVCVLFTWMESTFSYCAGCHIYKLLDLKSDMCAGASCEVRRPDNLV
ncbi:DUF4395 domain-containing protein [Undibacterium fentianense]|uniref:DUF4395 domain-containing protein n=1 Tax=Undibacterium fentianense TaxID=2828728 RepID=A0A941IEZ6_9BURK|nr:DUF4395 domain-containing protein [Undibacterium fentianense]MBR7800176.1 DUF4395 domain-containing protein [Undibacterium fentianense]